MKNEFHANFRDKKRYFNQKKKAKNYNISTTNQPKLQKK